MTHELKILPTYFAEVEKGTKKFELRKNDRNYNVGDMLILKEWWRGKFTGRQIICKVDYMLPLNPFLGELINTDFVILSISKAAADNDTWQRIKERIRSYRLDCEFAGLGMRNECKICNKNVFDSIEKIIDEELKGGKSEI